jgi:sulfite reductase (NADPH) flavoprotein alpha-component
MAVVAPALPDNAPFSANQRAWLNGYLAGLFAGGDVAATGIAAAPVAGADAAPVAAAPSQPEDFPWHDPALGLDERLALAEGRPRVQRLMAAMAQLDCGQCGYLCLEYAERIAGGAEADLKRCVPGGKATARMLKELLAEAPASAAPVAAPVVAPAPNARTGAMPAALLSAVPLNGAGSAKDTRHIVFRLDGSGLDYQVGDSLGVHATNCPALVDALIDCLGGTRDLEVDCPDGSRRRLWDAFLAVCDIARPSDEAIEVLASRAQNHEEADLLQAMAEGYPGSGPEDADLLDLLVAFPSARPPLQELVSALGVLQPRLYSLASSPKATPGEAHLTVAAVRYRRRDRLRKGVASTFLAERAPPGDAVPVFVQASHGFRLPADGDLPLVMIGPGTGIAPFRAFLQERRSVGARGRNWLFFGDQHGATDFLYRDEVEGFVRDGLLTRLDTAFSRDQADKIYVQHRMRQNAAELWAWLQDGARVYVCGDATRMAKDVDTALTHIIAKQGRMEMAGAKAYLAQLARDQRYQRDVY